MTVYWLLVKTPTTAGMTPNNLQFTIYNGVTMGQLIIVLICVILWVKFFNINLQ